MLCPTAVSRSGLQVDEDHASSGAERYHVTSWQYLRRFARVRPSPRRVLPTLRPRGVSLLLRRFVRETTRPLVATVPSMNE